jgi:hypothetical protein
MKLLSFFLSFVLLNVQAYAVISNTDTRDDIKLYRNNGWYWEYKEKPVMLLGGSDDDNLFQWTGNLLTEHLDQMKAAGGNYVRNTMSDRDQEEGNVYPVKFLLNGKYDLNQWNEEYWDRLQFFFDEALKCEIIAQITLWDWFDLHQNNGCFDTSPLNPENNINWESGTISSPWYYYGGSLAKNNQKVLDYQHRFIDKLMTIVAQYGNVLYNIGNESKLDAVWDNYWASYIKETAKK